MAATLRITTLLQLDLLPTALRFGQSSLVVGLSVALHISSANRGLVLAPILQFRFVLSKRVCFHLALVLGFLLKKKLLVRVVSGVEGGLCEGEHDHVGRIRY